MENKFIKYIFILILLILNSKSYSQNNPGFLGKKIAAGYSLQYCLLRTDLALYGELDNARQLYNHNLFIEYAISKYKSYSLDIAYQKVPLRSYGNNNDLYESYTLNGKPYTVAWRKGSSISDFSVLGIGLRINAYSPTKSISAPIGVCSYFRVDLFSINAIKNNYKYTIVNEKTYTPAQVNNAKIPVPEKTSSQTVSIGFGMESKAMISRTLFMRFNGEFNLSSGLLSSLEENYDVNPSINNDLKESSRGLNSFRNMFILGMGVGGLF